MKRRVNRRPKNHRKKFDARVPRWRFPQLLEDRLMLTSGFPDVLSVGRTLSSWSVADLQDRTVLVNYTVFNQQADEVNGVLLTTSLQPGVAFLGASQLPDQNGQELAWSLGTLSPYGRASVEVTLQLDPSLPLQLDDGAEAFGTMLSQMVSDAANPALLRNDPIDPTLLASTPDANWQDPFVQAKAAELNQDATEIFAYLTQDVGYESYSGSLRGARGTLWSGAHLPLMRRIPSGAAGDHRLRGRVKSTRPCSKSSWNPSRSAHHGSFNLAFVASRITHPV